MWVGWYRRTARAPWVRACQGATLTECSRRLTDATRRIRLRNTDYFLTTGHAPREGGPGRPEAMHHDDP